MAAGLGQLEVVRVLRAKGANLNQTDGNGDNTAFWAARHSHSAVLNYLIREGVHINNRNKVGQMDRIRGTEYTAGRMVCFDGSVTVPGKWVTMVTKLL